MTVNGEIILALPMHGEVKLRNEGLRTRDAHVLEWISRLRPQLPIHLYSRPEPWPRVSVARRLGGSLPASVVCNSPQPLAIPPVRDRRRWWIQSRRFASKYPANDVVATIVWNPTAPVLAGDVGGRVLFDLLDDWLIHPEFEGIRSEVRAGYADWFERADLVTANSEATLTLAHSYGRDDAVLILNGCDPERFKSDHNPTGDFIVGYGGKISERLDTGLIKECAAALPGVIFEFAGPILARRPKRELNELRNVRFLGDVAYRDYPEVFVSWDIAWVPHRVGSGETGGDLIKLYEYRAAGLPTISTRVAGWERAMPGVTALDRDAICSALEQISQGGPGSIPRECYDLPAELTWSHKTGEVLSMLHL